jgi:ABC-type uncharacterized transport system substrate-binding protein
MNKKIIAVLLVGLAFASVHVAEGQQAGKVPRIGILAPGSSAFPASARYDSFRQGLRELGYIEGKNIFIEIRYAEAKQDRLSDFATELVKLKVDVIVTATIPGVLAVKNATSAIPIVFAAAGDPVRAGLVSSLARPVEIVRRFYFSLGKRIRSCLAKAQTSTSQPQSACRYFNFHAVVHSGVHKLI